MAVVMTMRWAGVSPEQYDELRELVGMDAEPPPGGIYHVAAFDEDGIRVTDVWETAEDFETFAATRLMPSVHKLGVLGEPTVEIHPAHATFAPAYRSGPGAAHGNLEASVRAMFEEVVNKGRLELVDEIFAPSHVSHVVRTDLDLPAFKEFIGTWRVGFPDLHTSVENCITDGDRIAWTVRATGTHRAEFRGIPATGRKIDFLSINEARADADGRIVEHWVVMDQLGVLQQLGVVPEM